MKPLSFRTRIALLSALISGLVLVGLGSASLWLLYRQKLAAMDTEIRSLGMRHPGWLASRSNFERLSSSLEFIFGEEHKGRIIFMVRDADGSVLYRHANWPADLPAESVDCTLEDAQGQSASSASAAEAVNDAYGQGGGRGYGAGRGAGSGRGGGPVIFTKIPKFFTVAGTSTSWRVGVMGNENMRLVVGLDYDAAMQEVIRMRNFFLLALPLALVLVGGGGWLVAVRALRPLETIAHAAEQVTIRGLDQRIPSSNEDPAIRRLIEVLNSMMDRLEASFRQATRFSADASHELKTPLAIMQNEIEAAIQEASPGSASQRTFGSLLEQTQQLKRITGSLLLLAQADAGRLKLATEEFCLSEAVSAIVEDAQVLAEGRNITFSLDVAPDIKVRGDRGLLQMALLNLATNAVRYNENGGWVKLSLASEKQVFLSIANSGPGVPEQDQPYIFDRFYRVRQQADREGLGLGLSLAREIILAHQGSLTLEESRPGYTRFVVSLPRA